ncbi:MAG: bifunctional aspartate transaminase/aspartate 4-decarboxylase [Muribaculaceae bacterium]|nr:bifunctional aspartate transaminase/aspartate 4-decarboxylase [Muribaculaceae bacterium]
MNKTSQSLDVESRRGEKELSKLSPFEIKGTLINLAEENARKSTALFLNAGRGNPNWIATQPREAFFLLGKWGLQESRRTMTTEPGIAGTPLKGGSSMRFKEFLIDNASEPGVNLLSAFYTYMVNKPGVDPDELTQEWAEGIMGDSYPTPDRILKYTEVIIRDYLAQEMGDRKDYDTVYDLFATEGGTAAMCYAFDSLAQNFLLKKGDKIALMTPIFTPYIEIPQLARFDFDVINIQASATDKGGYHTWQYPKEEIDKLRDPSVKFLCIVNPSNPPSYTLSSDVLDQLVDVVKKDNPDLMIVTDDVYGTFVSNFRSLMYELPYNTMCVYSFSKYFGATGWRLATIAIRHDDNVFDSLLSRLPEAEKRKLAKRYESLTMEPEKLRFIDRMVADSRMVALNHTAGLSTPQQIQMALFAAMAVLDRDDTYKKKMMEMIHSRLKALWDTTGFTLIPDPLRAGYYSEIDLMVWARKFYGDDFAEYLQKHYEPLDAVIRLARHTAVVLLNGDGFDGPDWSVRVSLANLNESDYRKIGTAIRSILDGYHDAYVAATKK